MEASNIIALALGGISFIISIVGFVLTPILNLKSKRLEKRLEYRFELFQKILELWELTHDKITPTQNELEPLLREVNKLIQLYGYNSEINSFKEVVKYYNFYGEERTEINRQKMILKFNNFLSIAFNAYRKEIVMETLNET
jgi:uncharacterized membrane protein YgaE (UPF0421/DUF939 family)